MNWKVYLSGEIHSDWRKAIEEGAATEQLPVEFFSPVLDHTASDNCGVDILGPEDNPFWKDRRSAGINAIRTHSLIRHADVVVVRFAENPRQWNAAFDAGFAAALGKPLIIVHEPALDHPLKEVDTAALAVAETPEQVVRILRHVTKDTASD